MLFVGREFINSIRGRAAAASAVAFDSIVRPTIVLPVLLVDPSASGMFCTRRAVTACPALSAFELRIEPGRSSNMIPGRTEI